MYNTIKTYNLASCNIRSHLNDNKLLTSNILHALYNTNKSLNKFSMYNPSVYHDNDRDNDDSDFGSDLISLNVDGDDVDDDFIISSSIISSKSSNILNNNFYREMAKSTQSLGNIDCVSSNALHKSKSLDSLSDSSTNNYAQKKFRKKLLKKNVFSTLNVDSFLKKNINDSLNDVLMLIIFSYLQTNDLLSCQLVCKRWYQLIWSPHNQYRLWNHIYLDDSSEDPFLNGSLIDNNQSSLCISSSNSIFSSNKTSEFNDFKMDADKLLKYLLTKKLNQLTYPMCLSVESITIKNNHRLTDKGIDLIATRCPELKYFSIRNCSNVKTSKICKLLSSCSQLKFVDFSGCFNVINLINYEYELANLRNNYFSINPKSLSYFYLEYADLSDCVNINDDCIKNLTRSCIYLRNFYLRRCKNLTDTSLHYIAKYSKCLIELSLCQCVLITDHGVKCLTSVTKIKYLSLAKCPLVTDRSLIHLSKRGIFNQIKYLNLRGCQMITDKFLKYLCGCNTDTLQALNLRLNYKPNVPYELKSLDLGRCSITDKSLEYLAHLMHFLPNNVIQRLSLKSLKKITDDGLRLLALNCKHLQYLNVTKCPRITIQSLKEIKENCKNCIIQHNNLSFC